MAGFVIEPGSRGEKTKIILLNALTTIRLGGVVITAPPS